MAEASHAGVVRELLSPLAHFLQDASLYEIVINRPGEVLTEGEGGWQSYQVPDLSFEKLMRLARAVASYSNQAIDEQRPILSATLPDDERIQVVIPPATLSGTVSITLRKPSSVTLTLDDLDRSGLFSELSSTNNRVVSSDARLAELQCWQIHRVSLRGSAGAQEHHHLGATGSGKTTLSKALIRHIPTTSGLSRSRIRQSLSSRSAITSACFIRREDRA